MARYSAERAKECKFYCKQLQPARILVVVAINGIANHWKTIVCKVAPDLVLAASDELHPRTAAIARRIQVYTCETGQRCFIIKGMVYFAALRQLSRNFNLINFID